MSETAGSPEAFSFADDAPRLDPWAEDDFGYRPFAERVANVVWELQAPNGYVIGLHGAWGAGKTTALNFIAHFLASKNRAQPGRALEIVRFAPWMVSGRQDLIGAFFRVLAEGLNDGGETLRKVRKTAHKTTKAAIDPTVTAAIAVAVAAHPPEAVAIRAGGAVAKSAMEQTVDAWLGEPTLQATYERLVRGLRKRARRFVVFIDDIDRLEASEVKAIMQMVKSVGQLPNVIYVLAYDRRIVWRALGEREQRQGGEPTFTEKIIQHELELPHIGRSTLLRRLDRELQFVFDDVRPSMRWMEIVRHGFHRWIRIPRDIVRISNALRFAWPPLAGEVDAADVVAMEGLRLFDPKAFDWVRSNRDFLVDGGRHYMSDSEKAEHAATFRESLDPGQRDDIVELLSALFPAKSKILRPDVRFSFGERWADTVNRRGVGSPKGYDAYFSLFPSAHVIPKALVDQAVAAPDDDQVQLAALARAIEMVDDRGRSLVSDYIDELQYRQVPNGGLRPSRAMLKAFVKRAAFIQGLDHDSGALFSPSVNLHVMLRAILAGWDPKVAGEALLEAVADDAPAAVLATLWVWRARESEVLPSEGSEVGDVIDRPALNELGRRALTAILAERDSTLVEAPYYWDILRTWAHLGSLAEATAWLSGVAQADPHVLARVSRGILSYSTDSGKKWWFFRGLGSDNAFYDPEALLKACETFAERPGLDAAETDRIVALRDGLRQLKSRAGAQAKSRTQAQGRTAKPAAAARVKPKPGKSKS